MGLFSKKEKTPDVPTTPRVAYFTETGELNEHYSEGDGITQGQYDDLRTSIRNVDRIYCPFSLRTGHPYLYMDVLLDDQGYGLSKTKIQLWTESENARLAPMFTKPDVEVIPINAGNDGRGIIDFLGTAFYENGAEYANINGVDFKIPAEDIIPKPDFSQIPESQRPLMNPVIVRNQCLLAQLIGHQNPVQQDLERVFMDRFGEAVLSSKVLFPVQIDGEKEFSVPTWKGRGGREFVRVFTDWRKLRSEMDPEKKWNAAIETVGNLIGKYDVALNSNTTFEYFGIYIDQARYQSFCK